MTFIQFLFSVIFLIFLYIRLKNGPYIYQSSNNHYINIKNHKFDKDYLNINKGDNVIFINKDQIRHTIKSNNNNIENSPILFQNDTWEIVLEKSIIFKSSLYSNMNKLEIIVNDKFKDNSAQKVFKNNLLNIKNKIFNLFEFKK